MATNNAVNLKSSGIVSYDGSGTFSALANPLTVANGGTGVSSNTAYAVLSGGTTSTNPIQSIASVGTSGHVLMSNGASSLPTFQMQGSYIFTAATREGNPSASVTYFMLDGGFFNNTIANANIRQVIPRSGTITAVYGAFTCTAGSNENASLYIRLNDTTDTAISTTLDFSSASFTFNNTGLSIAVSPADFLIYKFVSPAWVTPPTVVRISMTIYVA